MTGMNRWPLDACSYFPIDAHETHQVLVVPRGCWGWSYSWTGTTSAKIKWVLLIGENTYCHLANFWKLSQLETTAPPKSSQLKDLFDTTQITLNCTGRQEAQGRSEGVFVDKYPACCDNDRRLCALSIVAMNTNTISPIGHIFTSLLASLPARLQNSKYSDSNNCTRIKCLFSDRGWWYVMMPSTNPSNSNLECLLPILTMTKWMTFSWEFET